MPDYYRDGWYGHGMMSPGVMGGYAPARWVGAMGRSSRPRLSADDVKTYLERWVAMMGNPNIKS